MLAGFSCPSINKISLASLLRTLSWTSKARMDVAFMLHNTRHHLLCKMWKMSDEEPLPFSLLLIFILIFLCLDSCKLQCLEALQFSHIVQSKSFYFLFLHCHHFFFKLSAQKKSRLSIRWKDSVTPVSQCYVVHPIIPGFINSLIHTFSSDLGHI